MDVNIKKALVILLNEEVIVSSWGLSNIFITGTSIRFHVDGFVYKGEIRIGCGDLSYHVTFDNGRIIHCSLHELLSVLDSNIEKNDDYIQNLEARLSSNNI